MTAAAEYRAVVVASMNEATLLARVQSAARVGGWRHYHTRFSVGSNPGLPDLLLVRGPRLVAAELKSERGKLSEHQRVWLDDLAAVPGVECFLWRPSHLMDGAVDAVLLGTPVPTKDDHSPPNLGRWETPAL